MENRDLLKQIIDKATESGISGNADYLIDRIKKCSEIIKSKCEQQNELDSFHKSGIGRAYRASELEKIGEMRSNLRELDESINSISREFMAYFIKAYLEILNERAKQDG